MINRIEQIFQCSLCHRIFIGNNAQEECFEHEQNCDYAPPPKYHKGDLVACFDDVVADIQPKMPTLPRAIGCFAFIRGVLWNSLSREWMYHIDPYSIIGNAAWRGYGGILETHIAALVHPHDSDKIGNVFDKFASSLCKDADLVGKEERKCFMLPNGNVQIQLSAEFAVGTSSQEKQHDQ